METIIKSFTGVFFMLLVVALGMGCVSAAVTVREADSFLSDAAEKIENSHYAEGVIASCIADAKAHEPKYELSVDINSAENDVTKKYGTATMSYSYSIPIMGVTEERSIHEELR